MKVTHVNVRLSEGGAAMVARTLVDALPKFGVDTEFVYGYGPSGRKSPLEEQYKAARTTNRATVAINITSHSLTGREAISPLRRPSRHWFQAVSTSDIVHLHVIHSYMANPNRLLETLGEMGRPVVWTLHDQWAMTGRCAQPASCQKWRTGCGSCPDLSAYPPAKIDHSSREWRVRRSAIHNLTRKADVTTVACADWLAEEARRAGLPNVDTNSQLSRPEILAVGFHTAPHDAARNSLYVPRSSGQGQSRLGSSLGDRKWRGAPDSRSSVTIHHRPSKARDISRQYQAATKLLPSWLNTTPSFSRPRSTTIRSQSSKPWQQECT